jgi:hypothetical protein
VTEAWQRWAHVIIASAFAVPLLFGVAAARARRIGRLAAAAEVIAVAGNLPWLWMVLTPLDQESDVHLVPLHELAWYLNGDLGSVAVQLVGNLAVFAAFGAAAPVRWPLRLPTIAALAAAGSATVEIAQYLLDMGRVASVDDVLLNTAGAVLAALATRRWWRTRRGAAQRPAVRHRDTHAPRRDGSVDQR